MGEGIRSDLSCNGISPNNARRSLLQGVDIASIFSTRVKNLLVHCCFVLWIKVMQELNLQNGVAYL